MRIDEARDAYLRELEMRDIPMPTVKAYRFDASPTPSE